MGRSSRFSAVQILPAPTAIFAAFLETPGVFLRHLGSTLGTTCLGFGLAGGSGLRLRSASFIRGCSSGPSTRFWSP